MATGARRIRTALAVLSLGLGVCGCAQAQTQTQSQSHTHTQTQTRTQSETRTEPQAQTPVRTQAETRTRGRTRTLTQRQTGAGQVTVAVGSAVHGSALPSNYLGLALTYQEVPGWVGSASEPVDPVLVQLIRNLSSDGQPVLRIGGESADHSWWPIPGYREPYGITYDLTPAWTTAARRLAQATDAKLMLGLDLQADRTKLVQVEADQLLQRIGGAYIQSFQIGNEPDLYSSIAWYKLLDGHPVPQYSASGKSVYARPSSYDPADFAAEVARMLRAMPRVPISGPETSTPAWVAAFDPFLRPSGEAVTLTTHAYAGNRCVTDPSQWEYPSVPHLLSIAASHDQLAGLNRFIGLAHSHGDGFRVDELGTIACSGEYGVSNSMAASLWLLDTLFAMDQAGVNGVNLHTVAGSNALFTPSDAGGHWSATVAPWYYGALMFTAAAPAGSRLLTVSNATRAGTRVWATLGTDHVVRVLVINDKIHSSVRVLVHNPRGYGRRPGTLELLRAAGGAYATGGVTIGGRGFGHTTTGTLSPPVTTAVDRGANGYTVTLPAASAGLLTLQPAG
jgi:hypothetical protein